jgi:hypothetical protein
MEVKTMEKIINEFKIIETDDGFRVEIKGDKEVIRKMFSAGPHHFFRGKGPFGHHFPFGPGFWGRFGGWCAPWDEPEEEKSA